MFASRFRRNAITRTIAATVTTVLVVTPPLNAFAQLAASQRGQQDSVDRLLSAGDPKRESSTTQTRPRARVSDETNSEKPVMPRPVLPTKLEWISGGEQRDPWDLFDGRDRPVLTSAAELRIGLATLTHIDAITVLGPAHGTLTVQSEDAAGTHAISELSTVASTCSRASGDASRALAPRPNL